MTTKKSCLSCPSYAPADKTNIFRKGIGVGVCTRFGRPIGKTTSSPEDIEAVAHNFAEKCDMYGKLAPATPDWSKATFQVMLPDVNSFSNPKNQQELVSSCAMCEFFVREDVVANELGWNSSLCKIKGKLLLSNRYTIEARNCDDRSFGSVSISTVGLTYLPEYEDKFSSVLRKNMVIEATSNRIDPSEYETDSPVSEEDIKHGIRAWRKIDDPVSGNSITLPIYNPEFFSDEERSKIPSSGDDEHPEDYLDHAGYTYKAAVLWTKLDETPALWGKAGTGKTEFFRHMAWLMQLPFERFSITGSTELDDLAGKMHFTEGQGTHFEYGRLPLAWMKPSVIVIDEPNTGPPDVWQFLRPLTDNSKQLVLDMNSGERIVRHDDCYLGMAMNPAWDILNVGTQTIGDADANRLMHLFVELPPPDLEKEIIRQHCSRDDWDIPEAKLVTVMKIADDIRSLTEDGTLPVSWAIRPQIKVARALRWFDYLTAYRMAAADYLEPQIQQQLLDVVRAHTES